jgi:hypothetical protein
MINGSKEGLSSEGLQVCDLEWTKPHSNHVPVPAARLGGSPMSTGCQQIRLPVGKMRCLPPTPKK